MKIVILQGAFFPVPPVLGGAVEKMWFALGKHFASRGHRVVHISKQYEDYPTEEWIDGVLHLRIKGYDMPSSVLYLKWLDLRYSLRAKSVIPKDADVIITNTFWAPLILSRHFKKRCFVDVQRMPKGQMKLYKRVSRLRANSRSVADAIRKELNGYSKQKIVFIPNPLPFEDKPEVNFDEKKPIILYVGRLHPEKGVDLLIKAFRQVKTDWTLKIIGPYKTATGGGGTEYFEYLKKLAEGADVQFSGPVFDAKRLGANYAEASVFVYPSIAEKGETFGLAPLEAMAWGCVPVVSSLGCFRDFIEPGNNGLLFNHRSKDAVKELKSALQLLISDADLRSQLSRVALLVQQTHSPGFIASHFLEEFEKMIFEE